MSDPSPGEINRDPFQTLGLPVDADEHQVRARYLELVKRFPPDREPDKFREIQAAFESARDPLAIAKSLAIMPDTDSPPMWEDVIETQSQRPPAMEVNFLLSLGNRSRPSASETSKPDGEGETTDESTPKNRSGEN